MFRPTQQQQQRPSHQIGINSQVQVKTESCNNWMPGTPSHITPNSKFFKVFIGFSNFQLQLLKTSYLYLLN